MKKSDYRFMPFPCVWMFVCGFILRLYYIDHTLHYVRQYDVSYFGDTGGHCRYIQQFLDTWSLPDFDPSTVWQMGHPPLHHFLCAVWIKIQTDVFGIDFGTAAENLQYLTLIYTMILAYIAYRIFVHFGLNGTALYIATGIVLFHPIFIFMSGCINNDILSVTFLIGALYMALRWYRYGKTRQLLCCALCIGLGMMTKLTVIVGAVPIAFLMIVVLIRRIREKKWKSLILPYTGFALISVPLGTWFPLYNHFRWGMDLLFVHPLDIGLAQYVGEQSFLSRCFDFSPKYFSTMYIQEFTWDPVPDPGFNDANPLISLLKTSCFEGSTKDYTFNNLPVMNGVAGVVLFSSILLAGIAFFSMIWLNIRKKTTADVVQSGFMLIFYATTMIGFYRNAAVYPFVCTTDFRYIPLTVVVGALFFGMLLMRLWKMVHTGNLSERRIKVASYAYHGSVLCSIVFCLASAVLMIGIANT